MIFFLKILNPECIFNIEERDQGQWLSATVTWTGWRCREGERVRVWREGGAESRLGRCDENRGMLLIMEKYPWLRGGKRGSQGGRHPLIFEPRFPAGVMATVHRAFSPSVIPPCRVLRSPQHNLPSSPPAA